GVEPSVSRALINFGSAASRVLRAATSPCFAALMISFFGSVIQQNLLHLKRVFLDPMFSRRNGDFPRRGRPILLSPLSINSQALKAYSSNMPNREGSTTHAFFPDRQR